MHLTGSLVRDVMIHVWSVSGETSSRCTIPRLSIFRGHQILSAASPYNFSGLRAGHFYISRGYGTLTGECQLAPAGTPNILITSLHMIHIRPIYDLYGTNACSLINFSVSASHFRSRRRRNSGSIDVPHQDIFISPINVFPFSTVTITSHSCFAFGKVSFCGVSNVLIVSFY